jgi:tetratricopeptide (TPR) repeat protein
MRRIFRDHRASRALRPAALAVLAAVLACASRPAAAQVRFSEEVSSLGNRAQAAFLRADRAELSRVESDARSWGSSKDAAKLYGYAFVKFRVMLLAREARREEQMQAAGEACVSTLDTAIERSPRFADAYALRGLCRTYLAATSFIDWFMHKSDAADDAETARRLAPRNPRSKTVDALLLWFGPAFFGDQKEACKKFQTIVEAYGDDPDAGVTRDAVGIQWGAPEANLSMARCAKLTDDRELEYQYYDRALRFAPDFAAARNHTD